MLVAVLALGLTACSGKYKPESPAGAGGADTTGDSAPAGETGGTPSDCADQTGGAATLTISGFAFEPTCLRVSASGSLTVVNEDQSAHSFTVESLAYDETLDVGDTVEIKSLEDLAPGTYSFNCRFHPPMVGTLVVE